MAGVGDEGFTVGAGRVVAGSDKALKIQFDDDARPPLWVPVSVIHDDSEIYERAGDGAEGTLIVKRWWAEKEGLE